MLPKIKNKTVPVSIIFTVWKSRTIRLGKKRKESAREMEKVSRRYDLL